MARQRHCNECGEWHALDEPWPAPCSRKYREAMKSRSALPAPYYISDDLGSNGLLNHADNKVYTSKAAYVRGVKAAGCEIVGNDLLPRPKHHKPKLSDDVRREIRERVQALDSPTRKTNERRRRLNG